MDGKTEKERIFFFRSAENKRLLQLRHFDRKENNKRRKEMLQKFFFVCLQSGEKLTFAAHFDRKGLETPEPPSLA
jgi:hypothetical protein